MKSRLTWTLLIMLCIPTMGLADCLLPAYKAEYTAYIKGAKAGKTIQELSYANHSYKYSSITHLHYLLYHDRLFQAVRGSVRNNQLVPRRYYLGARSKGANKTYRIKKGSLDVMTYRLEIRLGLSAGKSVFHYPVVVGCKKMTLDYHVIQRGYILKTALGPLETVVVTGRSPYGATLTFWLSKKHQYLMVKSQLRRGAKVLGTLDIDNYKEKSKVRCPFMLEDETRNWSGKAQDILTATEADDKIYQND